MALNEFDSRMDALLRLLAVKTMCVDAEESAHVQVAQAYAMSSALLAYETLQHIKSDGLIEAELSALRNLFEALISFEKTKDLENDYVGLARTGINGRKMVEKVVRVYCDGVFDLFHYGHARALRAAKHSFPHVCLVVGVCSDADVRGSKGSGRPVLSMDERVESVIHCRWVDEVISDAPWVPSAAFLRTHGIDWVAHDPEPYAEPAQGILDTYAEAKTLGMFLPIARTPGISTTDLVRRCAVASPPSENAANQ